MFVLTINRYHSALRCIAKHPSSLRLLIDPSISDINSVHAFFYMLKYCCIIKLLKTNRLDSRPVARIFQFIRCKNDASKQDHPTRGHITNINSFSWTLQRCPSRCVVIPRTLSLSLIKFPLMILLQSRNLEILWTIVILEAMRIQSEYIQVTLIIIISNIIFLSVERSPSIEMQIRTEYHKKR